MAGVKVRISSGGSTVEIVINSSRYTIPSLEMGLDLGSEAQTEFGEGVVPEQGSNPKSRLAK
jgi:hypothetical protein